MAQFQIYAQIIHLNKRIELAEAEMNSNGKREFLHEYIEELEDNIGKAEAEKEQTTKQIENIDINPETLEEIRNNLRNFVLSIKINTPDKQRILLKMYLDNIILDPITESFKAQYFIKLPALALDEDSQRVLGKVIYFSFK